MSSFNAAAEKILTDLELILKKEVNISEFSVIHSTENKNCSPIVRGENAIALESWSLKHIYCYAHEIVINKTNNLEKLTPCLLGVALLNPDMSKVWNTRKELILADKIKTDFDMRLTKLVLSRKPKCNEALHHRRWIISHLLKTGDVNRENLLGEECLLTEQLADHYHSNYNAWSHRMWCYTNLFPVSQNKHEKKLNDEKLLENVQTRFIHNILQSKIYNVYFQEFENNFKFISSHVSDHSGLDFRQFLLTNLFLIFDNCNVTQTDENNIQTQLFCESILSTINNFIENGETPPTSLLSYLHNKNKNINLFDITISFVITELNTNLKLSNLYTNHEALWYYRRFLIFKFKEILNNYRDYKIFDKCKKFPSHQDSNGVSYVKDAKFDFLISINPILDELFDILLYIEKNIIQFTLLNSRLDVKKDFCDKYRIWLKQFFGIKDKVFT